MLLSDPLRSLVARAVHQAVSETDSDGRGVWLCEWYSIAGSAALTVLTGWQYEAAAGFSGFRADQPLTEPARHASGLPLASRPSWAGIIEKPPPDNAHAWIERQSEVIDFSLTPFVWGDRNRVYGHWYSRIEADTDNLQQKYYDRFARLADALTRRAIELTAPAVLASANGSTTHIFERIGNRWPRLADDLLTDYNRR